MFDTLTLIAIAGTFLLAGAIKGVIGLGLPTVSLALLSVAIDLPHAMALLLVPSFVTNFWQAVIGGNGRPILRRLWPFLLMVTVTVWIGTIILTRVDVSWLSALLGVLLIAYSSVSLANLHLKITPPQEVWVGPLAGSVSGILTGLTGSFVVPGVWFLLAIGLSRDMLIQAMGMLFTVSTFSLAVAMQGNNLLTPELATLSSMALLPAIIGMVLGRRIRQWLSERLFRRLFFISLLMLGAYIAAHAAGSF